MKATAKEFALSQIAPYFHNPRLCGYDSIHGGCLYRTDAGQMCVVGKNMLPCALEEYGSRLIDILDILMDWNQDDIFRPEVLDILTDKQWRQLQEVHDAIAERKTERSVELKIIELGLFTLDELKQYIQDALVRRAARRKMLRRTSKRRNNVKASKRAMVPSVLMRSGSDGSWIK